MASKSGGGGFFWGLVGFLIGVAATLAVLAFLSREPASSEPDPRTAADEAAAGAQEALPAPAPEPEAETAPPPAETPPPVVRAPEPGNDPATDDQIADDAASSGMTSRTRPPR